MAGYESKPPAIESAFTRGWFRTGDQGHMDQDGYVFITGRIKEIINRGGEKIAPREVDEALLEHPDVAQALAFAVPHPRLGEDVAAAVVLHAGTSLSEQALREFALTRLGDHKVPARLIFVEEIPKGPTGKLERIGLHERLTPLLQTEFEPPASLVEKTLAGIWSEVLSLPGVGLKDNFFALGGDSLLATRVASRVRNAFEVELPLRAIFRKPTLAGLALVIEEMLELARRRQEEATARILAELESLSEEQVEQLLRRNSP
jgi:hypothetical protein